VVQVFRYANIVANNSCCNTNLWHIYDRKLYMDLEKQPWWLFVADGSYYFQCYITVLLRLQTKKKSVVETTDD